MESISHRIMVSSENSPYMAWQTKLFYGYLYSSHVRIAGEVHPFTKLRFQIQLPRVVLK
jgi:hypothetical protein